MFCLEKVYVYSSRLKFQFNYVPDLNWQSLSKIVSKSFSINFVKSRCSRGALVTNMLVAELQIQWIMAKCDIDGSLSYTFFL